MTRASLRGLFFCAAVLFGSFLGAASAQKVPDSSAQARSAILGGPLHVYTYFPLEVGNEWLYSDGNNNYAVRVLGETQEANGRKYYEVSGYLPNDAERVRKLRRDLFGQILEYNPRGEDFLWYRIGLLRGEWRFETGEGLACIAGSHVRIGDFRQPMEVPAGSFDNTLRLDFSAPCKDAGIANEYFAGGVGLVRRVLVTIAGPRTVNLVSARVGSSRLPTTLYGVEVSVDHPVYINNFMPPVVNPSPMMKARLVVRNESDMPVELTFPTAQRFEFIVRDAIGKEVLRWSDGRSFALLIGQETLVKGSRSYSADLLLQRRDGRPLQAGFYTLSGYLTTLGSEPGLLILGGNLSFEIRDLH